MSRARDIADIHDGSTGITTLGTVTTGTFNGTIGTSATHGNINLQRTKSNSGAFSSGNNGDTHNILTMQDPGFYLVNLTYWRNSPNSGIKGHARVSVQYVSSSFNVTTDTYDGNSSHTIDVSNNGSTLQLLYNTTSNGSYTVNYQYIVVASHDI